MKRIGRNKGNGVLPTMVVAVAVALCAPGCGSGSGSTGVTASSPPPADDGRLDPVLRVLGADGRELAEPVAVAYGTEFLVEWDAGLSGLYHAELSVWDEDEPGDRRRKVFERNCNLSGTTDCNGAVGLYPCRVNASGVLTCGDAVPTGGWTAGLHLPTWLALYAPSAPVLGLTVCDSLFTDCRTVAVELDLGAL